MTHRLHTSGTSILHRRTHTHLARTRPSPLRAYTPTRRGTFPLLLTTASVSASFSLCLPARLSCEANINTQPYTTMSTTTSNTDHHEAETTRHLMGHPLPALINLPCTGSSSSAEEVDLFMLSLSSPIQVYCFSTAGSMNHEGLVNFNAVVPRLKEKERRNQHGKEGEEMAAFALTLDDFQMCQRVKQESKLTVSLKRGTRSNEDLTD